MRVLLLQDVKNVGKKDQIIEVSDGYANNFLLPKRLAIPATKKGIEIRDQQHLAEANRQEELKKSAELISEKLKNISLEFTAKAGKDGKMFGSISSKQIIEELKNKHQIVIDKRKFLDHDTINVFGFTKIKVELYKAVIGVLTIHVKE